MTTPHNRITVACPRCACEFVPEDRRSKQWFPPFEVGSETSYDAALAIIRTWKHLGARVFNFIERCGATGATTDEIEKRSGIAHQTISARVWELKKCGVIVSTGQKRPTRSGRPADVWVVLPHKPLVTA